MATEGDHDEQEHDPVKDVDHCKWKQEPKPEWPLDRSAAVKRDVPLNHMTEQNIKTALQ